VIDLHTHVLPGLDDGAASLDDSLAIVAAAAADGTTILAATPHVRDDYPTTPEQMLAALDEVSAAVAERGLPVELLPGGEVALERVRATPLEELRRLGLGGNPGYLLVEFPYHGWPAELATTLIDLLDQDLVPVLAHPERNADVQAGPARLGPLVAEGVLVQVTAASVTGALGRSARQTAAALVRDSLAHMVASDAHAPAVRDAGLSGARAAIRDSRLAEWLTETVPAAIVAREPIVPSRPRSARFLRR
jgi:protein-tyrosine phosphatase